MPSTHVRTTTWRLYVPASEFSPAPPHSLPSPGPTPSPEKHLSVATPAALEMLETLTPFKEWERWHVHGYCCAFYFLQTRICSTNWKWRATRDIWSDTHTPRMCIVNDTKRTVTHTHAHFNMVAPLHVLAYNTHSIISTITACITDCSWLWAHGTYASHTCTTIATQCVKLEILLYIEDRAVCTIC